MRNLKRALSLALASVMLLGMMVVGTSAAFTDADDIKNEEAVNVTAALEIFSGYGDGSFGATKPVNRAEMATLIVKMLKGADFNADIYKAVDLFSDIPADMDWAKGYINYAARAGVLAGYPDGTFKPEKTVSTAEAATMIINALKVDAGEGSWPATVMTKAVEMKLFGDLLLETDAPLTRDNLAVMLVEGILYEVPGTGKYYVDMVSGAEEEIMAEIEEMTFASRIEAKAYIVNLISGKVLAEDTEYTIMALPASNTLNATFGLTRTLAADGGVDISGRKATVYTAALVEDFKLDPIVTVEPYAVFEGKVEADEVKDALSKINAISNGTGVSSALGSSNRYYYIDGSENRRGFAITSTATAVENEGKYIDVGADKISTAEFIASQSNENSVIEVYAEIPEGKTKLCINKVIITNTYAEVVEKAAAKKTIDDVSIAKDKLYIDNDAITAKIVTGVAKGDVVLYTVANGAVQSYEKADSFTAKLESYNSAKTSFEIDGDDYVISASAVAGFNADSFIGQIGKDYVYFVDNNDGLIYATKTPDAEEETITIPTDYAIVLGSNVAIKENAADWLGEASYEVKAQIQVLLADGSKKVYDLPVTAKSGKFTVKVNNSTDGKTATTVTLLDTTADSFVELTDEVKAAANKALSDALSSYIYTYTVSGSNITLVSAVAEFTGKETKSGVKYVFANDEISTAKPVVAANEDGTVLANDKTVFMLLNSKGEIIFKTGLAALEKTVIEDAIAIVDVKYDKTNGNTNVATFVYAFTTEFEQDSSVTTAEDTVYVDGTYTFKVVNKKNTAVYTAYKADGTTVTLSEVVTDGYEAKKGVYTYKSDATFGDKVEENIVEDVKVGTIAGTTYQLGEEYVTVNASTKIVAVAEGASLAKGATVTYIAANGIASVIYITVK